MGDWNNTGPIRRYMEPVEWKQNAWHWTERGGHVVWAGGDLVRNLGAILIRRVMDADTAGEYPLPLGSLFPASLADICAFLDGQTDDQNLEDLVWGLMVVNRRGYARPLVHAGDSVIAPRAYALLKLTLMPGRLEWVEHAGKARLRLNGPDEGEAATGVAVKPEPAILARLRTGDVTGACAIAVRRLKASGLFPLASYSRNGARRDTEWSAAGTAPARLLAALLFPISSESVIEFAELVLRRPTADPIT